MKPARQPLRLLLGALAAAALLSFLLHVAPPDGIFPLPFASSYSPYAHRPKLLFLLAGQSNMAGRGDVPSPLPAPYRPHPRVLRLGASRRWVTAAPPLHADIDTHKTCGVGPTMPFAHHVLASASASSSDDSLVLGLGPCAVGGTRIWMWAKGQPLYEAAVARTRAAVADGRRRAVVPGGERHHRDGRRAVLRRQDGAPGRRSQGRYRIAQSARHPGGGNKRHTCVTAHVQYNNWQFASNELLSDVCFKVSEALEEAHCQTVAHLSLMIALSKQNHLTLEPYGRSFIKSVLQILAESTKANNSQMIISSIQMIHSITKSLDMSIISSEVTSIIHAMEQYRMIVCHASALQLLSQLRLPTYLASRKSVDKAKK